MSNLTKKSEAEEKTGGANARPVAELLKEKSLFASLGTPHLLRLAGTIEHLAVPSGTEIVRQGERNEGVCCLLAEGSAEVLVRHDEEGGSVADERRLTSIEPGDLFGEAPLLTNTPHHSTTVRTLEPCEVLAIRRDDLLEAMRAEREVAERIHELLNLRHLPKQAPGIDAHRDTDSTGEEIITLKDPRRGTYFRLSGGGYFLWQLLDGRHTLQDLMLEYYEKFGSFEPQAVTEIVGRLTEAGFAEGVKLSGEADETLARPTRVQRALSKSREILEWRATVGGVDTLIGRLYGGGVRLLYTRVAQLIFAVVTLAGLAAFALGIGDFGSALTETQAGGWLLLFWFPASLLALLIHEAGHAFTTKHYGREVPSVGVGWYWFGPIAYVDTSDMWLEGRRWPKMAVSLAGPYADMVMGGVAALGALISPDPILSAFLWQFALVSYIEVLLNLNPLMEFDGYYILIDWLDKPNLRPDALAWLGRGLPRALRDPSTVKGHRLELVYALGSVLYIGSMAVLTVVIYRLTVEGWIAGLIGETVASGLAWILAGAVVVLACAGVLGELRDERRSAARP